METLVCSHCGSGPCVEWGTSEEDDCGCLYALESHSLCWFCMDHTYRVGGLPWSGCQCGECDEEDCYPE